MSARSRTMTPVRNTYELMDFVQLLKDWADETGRLKLLEDLDRTFKRASTASDLIAEMGKFLKRWENTLGLPDEFRKAIPDAIKVAFDSLHV